MIVSGWQGRDSAICIRTCNVYMYPLTLKLLSHPGCHISLSRVPCALQCIHFSSVIQSCLTLYDSMDCSTLAFPVHCQLPELALTQVHRISDAIQSSNPLPSLSPPAFSLFQQQGLFKWISSSHQVAKVLEFQPQHQSFQMNIEGWFPLGLTD